MLTMVMRVAVAWVFAWGAAAFAQTGEDKSNLFQEAIENITEVVRTGHVGYATAWHGNRYVQCRHLPGRELRCEAAGTAMQPSLTKVLTPERVTRLSALGWVLDASFGNYSKIIPASSSSAESAAFVLQTLKEGYGADLAQIEVMTNWVLDTPCPPRNGPTQNLAGMINASATMRDYAIYTCSYKSTPDSVTRLNSVDELEKLYRARVAAELQRLRLNVTDKGYVVFDPGIGYVQCQAMSGGAKMYCEAQSVESWSGLASVLTPARIAKLHALGYEDPGTSPNYSKIYPSSSKEDAKTAGEILKILHEVYGYVGLPKLSFKTEQ